MASLTRDELLTLATRDDVRQKQSGFYQGWLTLVGWLTCGLILLIIGTILVKGLPAMNWEFLTKPPVEGMTAGGIGPMIRGTLLLMGGTLILVLPLGILGGVCLAEYVTDNFFTRLLRASVTSLAGTPSIVYGLFGLAIFVILMKLGTSLIAGWLTLSLFSLPVVALSTENAIRALPDSLAEGALALGLSKWQSIWRVVLPNALPGIVTGIVLTTGRAAGEAPPILLTAGIYYSTASLKFDWQTLKSPVANLPYHLAEGYRQGGTIPEKTIWGTCLTLMMIVLLINLGAIIVRSRVRARQS